MIRKVIWRFLAPDNSSHVIFRISWTLSKSTHSLRLSDDRTILTFLSEGIRFRGQFRVIDQWNEHQKLSRAAIGPGGSSHLMIELPLEGGVTEGAIRAFIERCERLYRRWKEMTSRPRRTSISIPMQA